MGSEGVARAAFSATIGGDIIERVAASHGLKAEQLTAPRARCEAVGAAMTLVRECCGLSLKEIGRVFGEADYAAVVSVPAFPPEGMAESVQPRSGNGDIPATGNTGEFLLSQ